ncbi:MAG: protein kinase [Candidatus Wallbacteria bacterium]|nr:protein kinase [Candidatus Wallbacteria bacterium]
MLKAGDTFKSYRIVELVGSGGSGAVYRARQDGLDREVALKVVKVGGPSAEKDRARFTREARSLARIRHAHVIPLYDFGDDGDCLYYSMEFAPGSSLDRRVGEGKRLGVSEAVAITSQVLGALEAVHAVGVLHRDIKPANVLVRPDGTALLSDFGLARESDATRMTRAGSLIGTLPYLPPELFGEAESDERSDLYQVAVLLYELLAGTAPYSGAEVLGMMKGTPVDADAAIARLQGSVPDALLGTVRKAMDPDPARRFGSAAELRAALGEVAGTRAAPVATTQRVSRPRGSGQRSGVRPGASSASSLAAAAPPSPTHGWQALAGVAFALIALVAVGLSWKGPAAPAQPVSPVVPAAPKSPQGGPAATLGERRSLAVKLATDYLLAESSLTLSPCGTDDRIEALEVGIAGASEIVEAEWMPKGTAGRLARVNGQPAGSATPVGLAALLVDGNNRLELQTLARRREAGASLRIRRRAGARLALPPPLGGTTPTTAPAGTPLGALMQSCQRDFEEGRHREALEGTERAVRLAPNHWEALWRRGFALHLANNVSSGLRQIGGALDLIAVTEDDPEKTRQEAYQHLGRALALNPRADILWHDLGLCYRNDRRIEDARRVLAFAATLNQRPFRYWWDLVRVTSPDIPKGQESTHPLTPLALAAARAALDPVRDTKAAWWLERGYMYRQMGLRDEARADFRTALGMEPANARARAALATVEDR